MKLSTLTLSIFLLASCNQEAAINGPQDKSKIRISWVDHVQGDFTFKDRWDYPEGIFKNEFGQLSCDGFCPPEAAQMMNSHGKIFKDSIASFYRLIDTTHQYHTIQCEAWCYEWAGTDYITVTRSQGDTITCYTLNNIATHSSLVMNIKDDFCIPSVELNSVVDGYRKAYKANGGYIKIDKKLWTGGTMKADFNFTFDNTEDPSKRIYWKGNIYASVEQQIN